MKTVQEKNYITVYQIYMKSETSVNNDSIKIKSNAIVNESWECFKYSNGNYIEAKITATDTLCFIGIADSVKTIGFQCKDSSGQPIPHSINNYTLLLSQTHGLIRIVNFYIFPDIESTTEYDLTQYSIIGIPDMIGKKNITYYDVFNYNIDDEFHKESRQHTSIVYPPYNSTTTQSIMKILDKTEYGTDSVKYTYLYCQRTVSNVDSTTEISSSTDTITATYSFNQFEDTLFDNLPEKPIFSSDSTSASFLYMNLSINGRIAKGLPTENNTYYNYDNDSCWIYPTSDACDPVYSFIEGLGGPYYYCEFGGEVRYNDLLYYKKGNEIWGNPLNCGTLVGSYDPIVTEDLIAEIFPNPVIDNCILKIKNFSSDIYNLQIFDYLGNRATKILTITGSETLLNLNNLKSGIYFYLLCNKSQQRHGKIVKK